MKIAGGIICGIVLIPILIIALILGGVFGALGFFGGIFDEGADKNSAANTAVGDMKSYEIYSDIYKLDIEIGAADFKIEQGESFSVESNLKNLRVTEEQGCLYLEEATRRGKISTGVSYEDAVLTIFIPEKAEFREIELSCGAGRLTIDRLVSESLEFELGAGEVSIGELTATKGADIKGGAGSITISGGMLCNLDLEMGMGQVNLTSALKGECELQSGLGEANIRLLGSRDDYSVRIEKGIGSIFVDGENITDGKIFGNGENRVAVEGGIGAINLEFSN